MKSRYGLSAAADPYRNRLTPQQVALTNSGLDDNPRVGAFLKTVVLVEQMQYGVVDPEQSTLQVWKVQVWRVMLVGPARGQEFVPAIDSI